MALFGRLVQIIIKFLILKVIKILAMIVILFIICWLPIHTFSLLVWFYPEISKVKTQFGFKTYVLSYIACHFLAMAHSFINPIVYCFMSQNFRVSIIYENIIIYYNFITFDQQIPSSDY